MGLMDRMRGRKDTAEVEDTGQVLDLREDQPEIDLRDDEPTAGGPSGCPDCGGPSYIDHIDMRARQQFEHCKTCGTEFTRPIDA